MKKLVILILAVSFAACDQKEPVVGPGAENPMTECASLDEINTAAGTNIVKPGVMGVTEEKFFTVKTGDRTIAEYRFDLPVNVAKRVGLCDPGDVELEEHRFVDTNRVRFRHDRAGLIRINRSGRPSPAKR
mgnify:CR=1 FL=1